MGNLFGKNYGKVLSDYTQGDFDGKIVIIGAGAAGLTAGYILNELGIDYQIIEASDRHGGRMKTDHDFADFPINLGAEWVHTWVGAKPPVLESILCQTDTEFKEYRYKPKTFEVWRNGSLKRRDFFRFLITLFHDYMFQNSSWFEVFDKKIYPIIADKVVFNSPVEKIDYGGKEVVIKTSSSTFTASKVLVTVPISILQNNLIEFVPELPTDKVEALNKEVMPYGIKAFIEFSEKFYQDLTLIESPMYGGHDDIGFYDAALGKKTSKHVLGFLAVGPKAKIYFDQGDDESIFKYILGELDTIFDGTPSKVYVKHIIQNWSAEPFIQGSYSSRQGPIEKLVEPLRSSEGLNNVYFAGEAMHSEGKTIAVHGASESSYLSLSRLLDDSNTYRNAK